MNLCRMNKAEYEKFRLVVNIGVFLAFFLVFIFVELKNIQQRSIMGNLIAVVILSSLLMMTGLLTIFPGFSLRFGRTLIAFAILIFAGVIFQAVYVEFSLYTVIELMLSIASFLYGKELIGQKDKFISLGFMSLGKKSVFSKKK